LLRVEPSIDYYTRLDWRLFEIRCKVTKKKSKKQKVDIGYLSTHKKKAAEIQRLNEVNYFF